MNKIKILYAEDDKSIVEFIKILLKKYDFLETEFVSNGLEALTLYEKNKFDLVITDMIMPKLDGFELIKHIRTIDSEQIVMMITGLDNKEDLIKAIDLRVHYFIEKPIKPKRFKIIFEECIEQINNKHEAELSNLLLNQYKKAIDSSTILSKTDLKGKITYANEAFYKIAQYSKEE
ncbi:MAG: response regulator, partial [Arcobacteraceae bacterium]